ncbi:hypothetical protein JCM10908_001780 [Rhodotorula pacifica]|uniref:uncharacterized protein n=1 Tax=Rhodotorula pacifica TaxID=1495444 RepID=UPI00316CFB25
MANGLSSGSGLTQQQVDGIRSMLNSTANKSWEEGTHAEALTEYLYPDLSPFAFPSSSQFASPSPSVNPYPTTVLSLAGSVISNQPWGQWQLIEDASAADPASVGPAVILANWTMGATLGGRNQTGVGGAAEAQIWALLLQTPRASDGAISHRVQDVQLWSDFVYMAPPFFAYYGLMTRNDTLIQVAYDQIRLYRQNLQDSQTKLWRHIYVPGGGSMADPGLWATGNGWVAGGILRVLATIQNSDNTTLVQQFASQSSDLAGWAKEVIDASWSQPRAGGLFHNYMNDTSTFAESASTALMIANTYRLALLSNLYSSALSSSSAPASQSLSAAEASYQALTANNRHISSSGVLSPVTDPMSFSRQLGNGQISPEGEAFVLLMEAARRDYIADGGKVDSSGGNADTHSSAAGSTVSLSGATIAAATTVLAVTTLSLYL